jgi:hypothetical protein
MVLVATSFLTFWLDWSSVPARAILGTGTMLSYFSNNRWSLQRLLAGHSTNTSMSALDVWRAVSMAFIYAACFEFVLVNFLGRRSANTSKVRQLEERLEHQQQKMQQLKSQLNNTGSQVRTKAEHFCQFRGAYKNCSSELFFCYFGRSKSIFFNN